MAVITLEWEPTEAVVSILNNMITASGQGFAQPDLIGAASHRGCPT